jgi:hypothetical protein
MMGGMERRLIYKTVGALCLLAFCVTFVFDCASMGGGSLLFNQRWRLLGAAELLAAWWLFRLARPPKKSTVPCPPPK